MEDLVTLIHKNLNTTRKNLNNLKHNTYYAVHIPFDKKIKLISKPDFEYINTLCLFSFTNRYTLLYIEMNKHLVMCYNILKTTVGGGKRGV